MRTWTSEAGRIVMGSYANLLSDDGGADRWRGGAGPRWQLAPLIPAPTWPDLVADLAAGFEVTRRATLETLSDQIVWTDDDHRI